MVQPPRLIMSEQSTSGFQLCINWRVTFFSVCLLPLLITLGFWQLDRAKEKQIIIDLWESQQTLAPIKLDTNTINMLFKDSITNKKIETDQRFRKIQFEGVFDKDHYWLLEGKTHRGHVGYQVVMPVNIDIDGSASKQWILVNRGWVKGSAYRNELPIFTTPGSKIKIEGNLAEPANALFVTETVKKRGQWPFQILEVDIDSMSKQLGVDLPNKIVKIDPSSPYALTAVWPKVNVLPAKHQAYAFQWFAMALALLILWLVSNTNIIMVMKENDKS